jgi:ribosomal protein L20A (L18A)
MGARHRARADSIQILKAQQIKAKDCKRAHVTQFHVRFLNEFTI